ncbi:MAG: polysaccharide deacetylase family protein [Methylacidiphilales bacterium]|nr:polysaccharide deacetylase family protein [Candidatus Methylacidiphilales bacterium]
MSVTRGKFLRSLGSALPGLVLGTGVAAAQALANKVAAVAGEKITPAPIPASREETEKIPFIHSGPAEGNRVALTFDDGPNPGVSEYILDALRERNVHATFFMIGEKVAAWPDLARRVVAEGHEIANHTWTHLNLTAIPDPQVEEEIHKTQVVIGDVLQQQAVWFRPPMGMLRRDQAPLLKREGLGIVFWSVITGDWAEIGENKIVDIILTETQPGSIIVCHDIHQQTADSLPRAIDGLRERGFDLVTVSTLLGNNSHA